MQSLLSQIYTAGDQAMRRRTIGPPKTLAGRLRSAIENNDSLELIIVRRAAALNRVRGGSYASIGRAARSAQLAARAKAKGHYTLAHNLQEAALKLLVGA